MCHVKTCEPIDSSETRAMTAFVQGLTYNHATRQMKISLWISRRSHLFAIAQDPELLDIFYDLNNKVEMPSASTISKDIKEIFKISRKNVAEMLQTFRASKAHDGPYLAARIAECLHEYGIQGKILALVADNASNNNTMIKQLMQILPGFQGARGRAILSQFSIVKRKGKKASEDESKETIDTELEDEEEQLLQAEEEEEEGEEGEALEKVDKDESSKEGEDGSGLQEEELKLDPDVVASDAAAIQAAVVEADLNDCVDPLTAAEACIGRTSVLKLRNLGKKIVNSGTIKESLKSTCVRSQTPVMQMVKDVTTRWNSMTKLIAHALKLHEAIKLLVIMQEYNKRTGVHLLRFQLSNEEWDILTQVYPLLDAFLYATKKISQSTIPLIHEVIPLFDHLSSILDTFIDNVALHPVVQNAALRGMILMKKYYALTDDSIVYRIAMILHPHFKTAYFLKAKWNSEWIETAKELACKAWELYKPAPTAVPVAAAHDTSRLLNMTHAEHICHISTPF
ncbi:hypothetical protein DXG01_007777 [Tephrocybe rancida]|nr:hypothetical protein DXG01_007777 [Tephrocybe rancida]